MQGQVVVLSYTDPTTGNDANALQDRTGNDVASFTETVTNNSQVTPVTAPGAPTGLTATAGNRQVTLSWTAPTDTGGAPIERYEYEPDGSGTWTSTGGTTTRYTVTGLTNGQSYTFRVRAVNRIGASTASTSRSATPRAPVPDAPTAPGAPTGLTATAGNRQVTLSWTAPTDTGGAPIERYEYEPDGSGTWTSTGGTTTRYTVTGLTNGQSYTFRVRAVNRIGASTASTASSSVTPAAAAPERFLRLNQEILALHALSLSDQTSRALTRRLATLTPGQPDTVQYQLGGQRSLAQTLQSTLATGTDQRPHMTLKALLGTSSFVLPLRLTDTGWGPDRMTLWGQGRYTRLARDRDASWDWDGDTVSAQVGADVHLRPDLLTGLAVTWADSGVDYEGRSHPAIPARGTHDNWMVSVQPYVGWQSATGLGLWATVGYGWGELTITDEQAGTQESDLTIQTAAVGASGPLVRQTGVLGPGATTLTLKSDAALTRVDVAGTGADLVGQTIDVGRLRLLLEGQHTHVTPTGERLMPFVEVGLRYDLGDGLTGVGAEVGGGLRYAVPRLGLAVEARGRGLVGHRGYTEWGASGLVRLDPGVSGQGLAVRLAPTYGPAASRVQQIWTQAPGLSFGGPTRGLGQPQQAGLGAEVGYGLANLAGARVFTPYGAATLGRGAAQYRLGGRWTGATGLMLSVEGVRQEPLGQQPTDQGLRLQATWSF